MKRKILFALLTLCMIAMLIPTAFAAEDTHTDHTTWKAWDGEEPGNDGIRRLTTGTSFLLDPNDSIIIDGATITNDNTSEGGKAFISLDSDGTIMITPEDNSYDLNFTIEAGRTDASFELLGGRTITVPAGVTASFDMAQEGSTDVELTSGRAILTKENIRVNGWTIKVDDDNTADITKYTNNDDTTTSKVKGTFTATKGDGKVYTFTDAEIIVPVDGNKPLILNSGTAEYNSTDNTNGELIIVYQSQTSLNQPVDVHDGSKLSFINKILTIEEGTVDDLIVPATVGSVKFSPTGKYNLTVPETGAPTLSLTNGTVTATIAKTNNSFVFASAVSGTGYNNFSFTSGEYTFKSAMPNAKITFTKSGTTYTATSDYTVTPTDSTVTIGKVVPVTLRAGEPYTDSNGVTYSNESNDANAAITLNISENGIVEVSTNDGTNATLEVIGSATVAIKGQQYQVSDFAYLNIYSSGSTTITGGTVTVLEGYEITVNGRLVTGSSTIELDETKIATVTTTSGDIEVGGNQIKGYLVDSKLFITNDGKIIMNRGAITQSTDGYFYIGMTVDNYRKIITNKEDFTVYAYPNEDGTLGSIIVGKGVTFALENDDGTDPTTLMTFGTAETSSSGMYTVGSKTEKNNSNLLPINDEAQISSGVATNVTVPLYDCNKRVLMIPYGTDNKIASIDVTGYFDGTTLDSVENGRVTIQMKEGAALTLPESYSYNGNTGITTIYAVSAADFVLSKNGKITFEEGTTASVDKNTNGQLNIGNAAVEDGSEGEDTTQPSPDEAFKKELRASVRMLYSQEYDITASATEGGTITPEGISKVKFDRNLTYKITPDEGYEISAVIVNGKDIGAVSEYTFKRVKNDQTITVVFTEAN